MITALTYLALALRPEFDHIDGKALGFTGKNPYLEVNCYSDKGSPISLDSICDINRQGEWILFFSESLRNSKSLILKISEPMCLRRKYIVSIPKNGPLKLTINRSDLVFGDLTGDNKIDDSDLKWVLQAVGTKRGDMKWEKDIVSTDSLECAKTFDFNHDGIVDDLDVNLVRRNLGLIGN